MKNSNMVDFPMARRRGRPGRAANHREHPRDCPCASCELKPERGMRIREMTGTTFEPGIDFAHEDW